MSRKPRIKSDRPDAIPDDKIIEWPLNASREWHEAMFGERADIFVRQLFEIHLEKVIERRIQASIDAETNQS